MPLQVLASIHGKAVYAGDVLYSAFHGQCDIVKSAWADEERDVYITFETIGQAHVNSCVPVNKNIIPLRKR